MKSFNEYRQIIERHLLDYLPPMEMGGDTLYEAMSYSLLAGGKRLRPVLLLATCDMAGGDIQEALPYAAALEFIHTYSLIHDDLPAMDNDDLRRGKPSNHKVFGEAGAILAGDGLLNSAYEVMGNDFLNALELKKDLEPRINAFYSISMAAGTRGMIAGQMADMDVESEETEDLRLEFIHRNKTAMLIQAAMVSGGFLGGADGPLLTAFYEYGLNLGLAFQMADDILDIIGDEKALGKKTGLDEANDKLTFIDLYGMDRAKEMLREYTREAISYMEDYGENGKFFIDLAKKLEERTY